ncbi:MAG: MFS transporter, partial [Acidimicrobiales bacterium]
MPERPTIKSTSSSQPGAVSEGGGTTTRALSAARLDRLPVSRWLLRTMIILFLGWLVESYDIGLIGNVLPSLTKIYHLGSGEKSLIATASTIGIVLGIIPAGYLADRFGRKRVFITGIVVYGTVTVVTGFATSPTEIVVLRLLAGLGMGAVFPMPYVLASEFCPASLRGRFTGMADSFLSVGYFLAPLIAIWVIPNTTSSGWRTMFFIGGIPLIYTLVIWKLLPESPRWLESKGYHGRASDTLDKIEAAVVRSTGATLAEPKDVTVTAEAAGRVPLRTLLGKQYLRRSLMLWITFGGTFFIFYAIQIYMPTVVTKLGYSLTSAFVFTSIIVGV